MHCAADRAERQHAHNEGTLMEIAERIGNRVSELTAKNGEFYPLKQDHIMAFFGDMLPHQEMVLQAALETPNVDFTGMLRNWIFLYWENQAEKQAIREIENELKENYHE